MSQEDRLLELVGEAAEVFGWEEFEDERDVEIAESEEFPYSYTDIVREDGVFRLFVTDRSTNLSDDLADYFETYREFEAEYRDVEQATLIWRSTDEEDFWYLRRTDEGDIGLFHSDLSLEEEDEEEEEGNGKKL
jgi:hypothetical protein